MGKISGLSSKMATGRINPGVYQIGETKWVEREPKGGGSNIINLEATFTDTTGTPNEVRMMALGTTAYQSSDRIVEVNKKGQLSTVGGADVKLNRKLAAGTFLASLNEVGFSPTKLDNIDTAPNGLDGQWVRIDLEPSGKNDENGKPYMNIVVKELLDSPKGAKGGGGGAKASSKPAPRDEEEEASGSDGKENSDDDTLDYSDEQIAAASQYVAELIASPGDFIKNFDTDAASVTLKQAHTAVFSKGTAIAKEHGIKAGELAKVVGDPAFHRQHTETWDDGEGTIGLEQPKPKPKGKKDK